MNRLFSIVQVLRTSVKPVTASALAETMEVSVRTIYRDIAELQMQNVPISGEAGIGYVLKGGFEFPPLMLTYEELEAALLGAQWVSLSGDRMLKKSAESLISKIRTVLPAHLERVISSSPSVVVKPASMVKETINMADLRNAIREQKKIKVVYCADDITVDEDGAAEKNHQRIIWPFTVAYFEKVRVIAAWCEMRQAFRHFRTDRISSMQILSESFPESVDMLKAKWWELEKNKRQD